MMTTMAVVVVLIDESGARAPANDVADGDAYDGDNVVNDYVHDGDIDENVGLF